MVHRQTEFYLVTFLNILFFFLVSFAMTLLGDALPQYVAYFGPAVLLIFFNFLLMYMFSVYVPFSLRDVHWLSIILSLAIAIPFAGIFVILKEPFPPFFGLLIVFIDALLTSIAEEVNFRGITGTLAEEAFSIRFAKYFQALFFTFFHFHFHNRVWYIFLAFAAAYVIFSLVSWWLYRWQNQKNILYPILFHTFTNFWMYILFLNTA